MRPFFFHSKKHVTEVLGHEEPDDYSPEVAIVKWAAGSVRPLPPITNIDEVRLLQLVTWHRLAPRLLHRMDKKRPAWCSKHLYFELLGLRAQAQMRARRIIHDAQQINHWMSSYDEEGSCIFIKGITTYALMGEPQFIRFSKDIDVFYRDIGKFWQVAEKIGYYGEMKEVVDVHESGQLVREGIWMEPHRYFPVLSYPDDMCQTALKMEAVNQGLLSQILPVEVQTEISYDDILKNSTHGKAPETTQLLFPDIQMSVLLLCAHEFRELVKDPFRLTNIKLCLLSEICDLCLLPDFDHKKLEKLIVNFRATDSVKVVGRLINYFLGVNLFKDIFSDEVELQFARKLTHFGNWYLFDIDDDLLFPHETKKLLHKIGANMIHVSAEGQKNIYGCCEDTSAGNQVLNNIFVDSLESKTIPFHFWVEWLPEHLAFHFSISEPLRDENEIYFVSVGGYEAIGFNRPVQLTWNDGVCDEESIKYECTSLLPLSVLPPEIRVAPVIPVLLIISRFKLVDVNGQDTWEPADTTVAVPLEIVKLPNPRRAR